MIKDLQAGDPTSVGPYRFLGRLGAGGMGQVYLGKSPGGRLVAIKLIRPELAQERGFRTRFSGEITAARNVSGIYTAAVVDADAGAELPWMATVYVPGPSLADAVEENGPLPVTSVLALAGGLAEALAAIHRAGLVHRDLKPSNVLLAADGPRVIDFGISLALERSMLTTTGMVMGSPGFMSPEQARGQREVGAPTDVFSLGAVLAYAATGNNPFGRGPTPALLYRVVNEVPDLAAVPGRLSLLIGQCLEKDPANRPTPEEILALLGDDVGVLGGEWLPPSLMQTMTRYSPPPTPSGRTGPAPTTVEPAVGGLASATLETHGPPPETAVAAVPGVPVPVGPVPGAAVTAGRVAAGDTSGLPPGGLPRRRPPSPFRRWRWPALAGAAAVIVAVVAILLTTHSRGGTPTVNPTASLAGNATQVPKTPVASSAPAATPTAATAQPTSQPPSSAPATQAPPANTPTRSASPTQATTSTPTQSMSSTPTTTPSTTAPTTTPTTSTSTTPAQTQSSAHASTTSPSGTPTSHPARHPAAVPSGPAPP